MFIYKTTITTRNFVLGAFWCLVSSFVSVRAMEISEDYMNLTGMHVESPRILSHRSPVYINKQSFEGEKSVKYWYKSEYVPVPTWQDIAKLAYQGTLTSEVLGIYVRSRIDDRIAYYRYLLSESQFKKLSKEQVYGIPPCVRYNNYFTSYDLLDKVFLYSDSDAKRAYDAFGHKFFWAEQVEQAHAFVCEQYIFISDYCSAIMLGIIEHEITHLFQQFNSRMIEQVYFSEKSGWGLFCGLTNRHANMIIDKEAKGEISVSKRFELETEADQAQAVFIPNNQILRSYCLDMIKQGKDCGMCEEGYLSHSAMLEYNKKFHYRGGDGVQEFAALQSECKNLKYNGHIGLQRYQDNLSKDLNREFLEKVCEEL